MVFFLGDVNFIGAPSRQVREVHHLHKERERERERGRVTRYLAYSLILRSKSIDTIPSNFSQWLGRGQVIRAVAHTQHAETNHNVSSSVDEGHRGRRTAAVIGPLRYSSLPDKVTVIWINCPP